MKGTLLAALLGIFLAGYPTESAQHHEPYVVYADGNECAINSARLDRLRFNLNESLEKVIIIARLGDGERWRSLSAKRLKTAANYLDASRVVVAQGERVRGHGLLEFYWRGELVLVSKIKRGHDFCPSD